MKVFDKINEAFQFAMEIYLLAFKALCGGDTRN